LKELGDEKNTDIKNINDQIIKITHEINFYEEKLNEAALGLQKAKESLEVTKNKIETTDLELYKLNEKLNEDNLIFNNKLKEAGFSDISEYQEIKSSDEEVSELERDINDYEKDLNYNNVLFKKLNDETDGLIKKDRTENHNQIEQIKNEINETQNLIKNTHTDIVNFKNFIENYNELNEKYDGKIGNLTVISDICDTIKPKSGIPLKTFVLLNYLDEVLISSNLRLTKMSKNRFYFKRREEFSGTGYKGLEIDVFDSETGKDRSVSTLSGGEGFIASLSLALGLSDVVQNYSGGIELDSIFIDEGFGSLDSQSLDDAINAITEINKTGRMVGIISHVEELRERFNDSRLEIKKTANGSEAKFYVL